MPSSRKGQPPPLMAPDALDRGQRILFIGLSESDFSQASQAAGIALQQVGPTPDWKPSPIYICLSEAALVRYARPFMGNRMIGMKGKAALPLSYLPQSFGGVEAFHTSLMELRHQFGAHSDMTKRHLLLERLRELEHGNGWRGSALCALIKPPDLYNLRRVADAMVMLLKKELSSLADQHFPTVAPGLAVVVPEAPGSAPFDLRAAKQTQGNPGEEVSSASPRKAGREWGNIQ